MNRSLFTHLVRAGLFRFILPVGLTVFLFTLLLFGFVLPALQEQLMAQKRTMVCELTRSVVSTLQRYADRAAAGELSQEEAQARAIAFLRQVRYGPEDKDYFWINDMQPRIIMHPYRTDLEGKDVSTFEDPEGKRLFVAFVEKVQASGGGYVDYLWQWKDDASRIVPKVSYVTAFKPWAWVVGTGIYVEDVRAEIASLTKQLWLLSIAILTVVFVLCAFVIWQGFRGELKRAHAEAELARHRDHLEEMVEERTERLVQAQEALRDSERQLAANINFLPDAMFVVDRHGVILTWNRAIEDLTGYQADEMIGQGAYQYALPFYGERRPILVDLILHPEKSSEHYRAVKRENDLAYIEVFAEHFLDGAYLWEKAGPLFDAQGELIGAIEIIRNITERVEAKKELERYREKLEQLVEDRTEELLRVNAQLRQEIQERQQAEQTLRESERKYRELVENANSIILRLNPEGAITYVNEYFEDFFGLSEQEVIGKKAVEVFFNGPQEERDSFEALIANLATTPDSLSTLEMRSKDKAGQPVWLAWNNKPVFDAQENLLEILCIGNDVTLRKQAEQDLYDSEVRYRGLFEGANDGILLMRHETIIDCNQQMEKMIGRSREAIIGATPAALSSTSWKDGKTVKELEQPIVVRSGQEENQLFYWRHIRPDQEAVEMEVSLSKLDAGGQEYLLAIVRDISERRKTEEALRQSEEQYRSIFSLSPEAIMLVGAAGKVLTINPVVETWLEYPAHAFVGANLFEHSAIPEDQRSYLQHSLAQQLAGAPAAPFDMRFVTQSGQDRWGRIQTTLIYPEGDEACHLIMISDTTEQKLAAEEFQRLSTVIEQAAECVIITNPAGAILYVNPAFEVITGYQAEEILGKNPRILKSGEHDGAFYAELWETIRSGRVWEGRMVNKRKNGSLYHSESTISPIVDAAGNIVNFAAIARDVTKESQLEAQLLQSQKMEAIGALAGGIAHDLNNMLSPILGYTELAISDLPLDHPAVPSLDEVLKAANRAANLVQQILTFSRRTEQEQKPVRIQPVLREAMALLRGSLPATIEIQDHIDELCGPVLADATQIHQVIMNLGANAFHAMRTQQNGILSIGMNELRISAHQAAKHLDLAPGVYACITVSDTGRGMSKEISQRIFEPYFTTKKTGEGTGLGLATVHGIIKKHKGVITVYSEVGVGATFKIYLPLCISEERAQSDLAPKGSLPLGDERIMLVDDEEPIVQMLSAGLKRLGYQVEAFTQSLEAHHAFHTHPENYDLIVTDQTMPYLTGTELAAQIHQCRPELPIILCSGFSESVTESRIEALGIQAYLMKPISAMDLGVTIRHLLDGKSASPEIST